MLRNEGDSSSRISGHDLSCQRAGIVSVIGKPNAGKSSLVNFLTGKDVSIVTRKANTTRIPINGIKTHGNAQLVFVDTPGFFTPSDEFDNFILKNTLHGLNKVDITLLVVDARHPHHSHKSDFPKKIREAGKEMILVINKVDLVRKEGLLHISAELNRQFQFRNTFMISAKTGDGVSDLESYLASLVPVRPWLYPAGQVSDLPVWIHAAEITRQKAFMRVHDEIPYALAVDTARWSVLSRKAGIRIEQVILVESAHHRKIVLGRNGTMIKSIGIAARRDLESFLEGRVHLFLSVKVDPNWKQSFLYQSGKNLGMSE